MSDLKSVLEVIETDFEEFDMVDDEGVYLNFHDRTDVYIAMNFTFAQESTQDGRSINEVSTKNN